MNKASIAIATLIGTVIGAGILGIPYVVMKSGFGIGLITLLVVATIIIIIHLYLGEIALRTKENHRFIGYSGVYLGKTAKRFATFTNLFSVFGSLLVYILISGSFIQIISRGINISIESGQIFFWLLMTLSLMFGIKRMERTELMMLIFLALTVIFIFIDGFESIEFSNFLTFNPQNIFLPYGVLIYAFASISAVPLMRDTLKGEENKLKGSIKTGLFIAAVIYLIFVFLGVGVSGSLVSEDALLGMSKVVGEKIILLGALFGLFAISTSYIAYSFHLKQTLIYDLGIKRKMAVSMVVFIPILLFISSSAGFIETVILLGAIFGGLEGILLIGIYKKSREKGNRDPEYSLKISNFIFLLIFLVFVAGIFYELFYNI